MPSLADSFPAVLAALRAHYGEPTGVAPPAPFVAAAAAVLGGDASPAKVATAHTALADAGWLDPTTVAEGDALDLEEVLRESPIHLARKAIVVLIRLARWFGERSGGDDEALAGLAAENLRDELAAINGVGRATADALLLYALRRPVYPLDRATYRVFVRHGWLDPSSDYEEARAVVERPLGDDPDGLARFAAFMDRVGREFCRAGAPRCERCPLRPFLPDGGPVDPNG